MRRLAGILAIPLFLSFAACGTAPIPGIAVEGTTITIAVPRDFEVGYGRSTFASPPAPGTLGPIGSGSFTGPALSSGNLSNEDLQRGELIVRLLQNGTAIATLPIRYVTRAAVDPGSQLGRTGTEADGLQTQKLLFVDLPLTRASGAPLVSDNDGQQTFQIEVRRFRRSNLQAGANNFVEVPQSFFAPNHWIGWGDASINPMTPIPILIRDANGLDANESVATTAKYTPFTGWNAAYVAGFFSGIASLTDLNVSLAIPDPEFRVMLNPQGAPLPGAWDATISYPREKMQITGVKLIRPGQSGGYVSYTADPGVACSSTSVPGNLLVRAVDPAAQAVGIKVSYVLKSDVVGCGTTRVTSSQVGVTQTTAYNLAGAQVSMNSVTVPADFN